MNYPSPSWGKRKCSTASSYCSQFHELSLPIMGQEKMQYSLFILFIVSPSYQQGFLFAKEANSAKVEYLALCSYNALPILVFCCESGRTFSIVYFSLFFFFSATFLFVLQHHYLKLFLLYTLQRNSLFLILYIFQENKVQIYQKVHNSRLIRH